MQTPLLGQVGGRDLIGLGGEQLLHRGIVAASHHDADHIPGGGGLVAGTDTVDIRKFRAGAAQLLHPLIHHIHKSGPGASHVLRQCHSGIGSILQDHAVQQIPYGHLLLTFQLGAGCAAGDSGGDAGLDRYDGIQVLHPFHNNQGCNDLGKRSGGQLGVGIIGIDQGSCIALIDDGRLGRIQLPVRTGQGDLPVQRAAAVQDADGAEGIVRLGGLGILRQVRQGLGHGRVFGPVRCGGLCIGRNAQATGGYAQRQKQ